MVPITIKTERRRWVIVRGHSRLVMGPRQAYRWAGVRKIRPDDVVSWVSLHEACLALTRFSGQEGR